jgi:NADH-quinone oxidoreductase subunit C
VAFGGRSLRAWERALKHEGHLVTLVRHRLGAHAFVEAQPHPHGDRFVVERERLLEILAFLRRDPDADLALLVDICGIDRGDTADLVKPRFQVRWQLRSPRLGYRAHIVVDVREDDASVPSLVSLYPAAEPLERELAEMLGIYPDGHPSPTPLLLYSGFVGHPLRKDYRATKQQPLVPVLDDERRPMIVGDEAP